MPLCHHGLGSGPSSHRHCAQHLQAVKEFAARSLNCLDFKARQRRVAFTNVEAHQTAAFQVRDASLLDPIIDRPRRYVVSFGDPSLICEGRPD